MCCELWDAMDSNKEQLSLLIKLVSLILVFYGLKNWESQLNGTTRIKLAKTLLAQMYLISDLIHDARLSLPSGNYKSADEKEELKLELENKLKPINSAFQELQKTYYESRVESKSNSDKYFKELKAFYMKYVRAINLYLYYYDFRSNEKEEARKVVFGEKGDEFEKGLDKLMEDIDSWLRPKFQWWGKRLLLRINNNVT